jgi:hypothetical protein
MHRQFEPLVKLAGAAVTALGFVGTLVSAADAAAVKWQLLLWFLAFAGICGWHVWTQHKTIQKLTSRRQLLDMGFSTEWVGCLAETRLIDAERKRWVTERRFRVGVRNLSDALVRVRLELVDVSPKTGNVFQGAPLGAELHEVTPCADGPPTKTIDVCYEMVADNDISTSLNLAYADPQLRDVSIVRGSYYLTLRLSGIGEPQTRKFLVAPDDRTERLTFTEVAVEADSLGPPRQIA